MEGVREMLVDGLSEGQMKGVQEGVGVIEGADLEGVFEAEGEIEMVFELELEGFFDIEAE